MKHLLVALLLLISSSCVEAATCFWVGGTGTWNNSTDTAFWKSSSGGAGACAATGGVPKNAGDVATFDASSGGGTITVNVDLSIGSIIAGAFTGTLDWSANNKNVTVTSATGINFSGTGVRTINLGNGVWTLTGITPGTQWDMTTVTNLTFAANGSTIVFAGSGTQLFTFGTKTTNIVTIGARGSGAHVTINSGASTIGTLNVTAPNTIQLDSLTTITVTNAITWVGTKTQPIFLTQSTFNNTAVQATISSPATNTCSWCVIQGMVFTGAGTFTANNSFNALNNSGITFNGPAPFGTNGGCILGGWLLWRDLPEYINDDFPAWLEKAA